jgi:hypothetical protein
MRKKPIARDEIRFSNNRILTLPTDSVVGNRFARKPIERLWMPLLRTLKQPAMPEPYGFDCECRHCKAKFFRVKRSHPAYCCDRCFDAARRQQRAVYRRQQAQAMAEARAKARANRSCETCGEPINAQRSTMRFCSIRCRVVSHRARHEQ